MSTYQCIDVEQAKQFIDQGNVIIGDVRCEEDFENSHIVNACLLDRIGMHELINTASPETPIIIYCYHGRKSRVAANYLVSRGFKQVYSLNGGFAAWQKTYNLIECDN